MLAMLLKVTSHLGGVAWSNTSLCGTNTLACLSLFFLLEPIDELTPVRGLSDTPAQGATEPDACETRRGHDLRSSGEIPSLLREVHTPYCVQSRQGGWEC